ncbi:hypothetical protein M407DRAFT_23632 [Tulasnella calospora MUT 4182]|uniref:Uncharacterized protein n=1 Tax=Tulasnella calospora MUT 4182 TaxID=1051891 RepID=A0A0C3QA70_9AGAM|nr:hypothetical protein M407DRAFT_23632 [Tulasnella calospora MUT 4182]
MTLHPKKSSTKKPTVQSSITNYFTPNSNSRTIKAPPRPPASGKSSAGSRPPKEKEKENELFSRTRRESKGLSDDAEILDLVSDDDADFFSNPRPMKRTRRVISDEDDLFAPVRVSSSHTEVNDEPGPSTPFRTPFTLRKALRRQNVFLPPSSVTALPSSPLTATEPDLDPEVPTPARQRRQLDTFRDVIPSSQTQELSLISPRPSESVSPERPTTLSLPSSKALLTPNRHDSDDVVIPDSQASSPEKLSPVKLPSLQVRTPAKRDLPTTVSFNSSASSLRSSHSSSTTTQQDTFNNGSIVPSSRTFLLTMSDGPTPFLRPPAPAPHWGKSPSEEVIPSSQTQLVSPVRPQTLDKPPSLRATQTTPDRNSAAVNLPGHATQETRLPGLAHALTDANPTRAEINPAYQTSVGSEDGVSARMPPPQMRQSGSTLRSVSVSSTESQSSKIIAPSTGFGSGQISPLHRPSATIRRRVGPFAPTQSEESFKHPSLSGSTQNPFAKEEQPCLGSPDSHPLSDPNHPNAVEPTPQDEFNQPSASTPPTFLGLTQPLSFAERTFPSQYTQLSEGDSFRPPTESFFDRLAAAETVESSEDEMEEGF